MKTSIIPGVLGLFFVFVIVGLSAGTAFAETIRAKVVGLSQSAIYIDAGSASGLTKGNTGEVQRNGARIASIEVLFVSEKSASCKVMEKTSAPQEGDDAILEIVRSAGVLPKDSIRQLSTQKESSVAKPAPQKSALKMRVTGRIAFQTYYVDNQDASNLSFAQPSLLLSGRIENIAQSFYSFSLFMRSSWTDHQRRLNESSGSEWLSRIYEASLSYRNPASDLQYSAGRIRSNRISGIGDFDGLMFDYKLNGHFSLGAFGGTQPDLRTSKIKTDMTKYGAYSSYESGEVSSLQFNSVLAVAGEYLKGNINREFVYEQINLSTRRQLSLYQSGELNINRGWRRDAAGKTLELSSMLVSVRYMPLTFLTTSFNYDNRTNYRTYETKTVPDTLFDNHLQQGVWAGAELRFLGNMNFDVNGGVRAKKKESIQSRTGSMGFSVSDLWKSRVNTSLRLNLFKNVYSNGYQPTVSLSRSILPALEGGVQIGQDHYHSQLGDLQTKNNWLKLNLSYLFSRRVFGLAYAEFYRGGKQNSNRYFVELGFRL
jgi:hypothetical protein